MDFGFTEEQEKFRQEVRDFCATTPKGEIADPHETTSNFSYSFYNKVVEKGWIGLTFPKEYGGLGLDAIYQHIFFEEMASLGVPIGFEALGTSVVMCGPIILRGGTERQKKKYLYRLAKGDITWIGQAFTEPNAGSDLISIETRAVREGDDYIINGQKVFTSAAHRKNCYLLLMVRTDPDAPLEKGISFFLVPTGLAGMTVRPLYTMGAARTNELFLDNVRVSKEDLIGGEGGLNQGGDYFRELQHLDWSRTPGGSLGLLTVVFNELVKYIRATKIDGLPMGQDPSVRSNIAKLATDIEIVHLLQYKESWTKTKGLDTPRAIAVASVLLDNLMVNFAHLAMGILGLYGQLGARSKHAVLGGTMELLYRGTAFCLANNCGMLTRKNFIATQVLGLPECHGY